MLSWLGGEGVRRTREYDITVFSSLRGSSLLIQYLFQMVGQ